MIIEDPKTGFAAAVNKEGMLAIKGIAESIESHHAEHHGSTFLLGNGMIACDGTDNKVLVIKNNAQTELLFFHGLLASTDSLNGAYISVAAGVADPTAGHTAIGFKNSNFTKRIVAPGSAWVGDDITVAADTPFMGGFIGHGFQSLELGGTVILGYLDTLVISVNGENAKNATVGARLWFHGATL